MQIKQAWIGSYLRREGCVCSHDRPKKLNPISCVQRMDQATRVPSQIMYCHDRQIGFAFNFMYAICGSENTYAQITHSFLYCKSSTHNHKIFWLSRPPPFFLGFIALAVLEWKSDRKRMDVSQAVNGSLVEKQDDEDATPKILGSPRCARTAFF